MKKYLFIGVLVVSTLLLKGQPYIPYNSYVNSSQPHGQKALRHQLFDNVLYAANSRFIVTSNPSSPNLPLIFNGVYDQTAVIISGQPTTFTIDFNSKNNPVITYANGYVYLHFYSTNIPASVSGRVQVQNGTWINIANWTNVANNPSVYAVWAGQVSVGNFMVKLEFTITPGASIPASLAQVEFVMDRVGQYEHGVITKFEDQTLFRTLAWKNDNNVQTARIENTGNASFSSIGVNQTTPQAKLHIVGAGTLSTTNSLLVQNSNSKDLIRITDDANVRFGTTALKAKVEVNGDVIARKLKVTLNEWWPDYVFHKNYELPTLEFVEKYIREHKHLPEVPSADQVEKEGLDLGDMQSTLLKKIEELTLYIIEQNKTVNEQIQRSNQLKKEVQELKKEIKEINQLIYELNLLTLIKQGL